MVHFFRYVPLRQADQMRPVRSPHRSDRFLNSYAVHNHKELEAVRWIIEREENRSFGAGS